MEAAFTLGAGGLQNDGVAFRVRGVCYHPRPLGLATQDQPAWGDYCGADFAALHARDLPKLRAMGSNVVRVYGWDPLLDHKAFLDLCYNGGVDPIFVIVNLWVNPETDWNSVGEVDNLCAQFAAIEEKLAGHQAVLALAVGNEVNLVTPAGKSVPNGSNPAYWQAMERVAQAIKGRNAGRLVTVPINDNLGHVQLGANLVPHLDFWSLQVYRGDGFGSFFDDYSLLSQKPVLFTEFGMDAYDHAAGAEYSNNGYRAAQALVSLWGEMVARPGLCLGGCVFEYADDWGKLGSASTHEAGPYAHPGFPDGFMDEEWWGLWSVSKTDAGIDTVQPRAAVLELGALWRAEAATEGAGVEGRLINISSRSWVGQGFDSLVAGFIVEGPGPRRLLVRAVGPTLGALLDANGNPLIPGTLFDPRIEVHAIMNGVPQLVAVNDNWEESENRNELRALFASHTGLPFAPGSKDSALLGSFMPGSYTITISGADGGTGIALAEVYEVR